MSIDYEAYLSQANKYLKVHPGIRSSYLINDKMEAYSKNIDKLVFDWTVNDAYDYVLSSFGSHSRSTISNTVNALKDFIYFTSEGTRINPFASELLASKNIVNASEELKTYFTPEDIEKIIRSIFENKVYLEALIRTYYEGVARRTTEIYDLKYDDLNLNESCIKIKRGVKPISKKLALLYVQMQDLEFYNYNDIASEDGIRRIALYKPYKNALFQTTTQHFSMFVTRRFREISSLYGLEVKQDSLYYSGFLNYIANKVGVEECLNLVLKNGKKDCKILSGFGEDYLIGMKGDRIRFRIQPYAEAMKKVYN